MLARFRGRAQVIPRADGLAAETIPTNGHGVGQLLPCDCVLLPLLLCAVHSRMRAGSAATYWLSPMACLTKTCSLIRNAK